MNNWEEIEKQVHEYATAYWASDRTTSRKEDEECAKEMANALANIKGIVDAMESQIPKLCSHGVSMQEPCDLCSSEAERGVMTVSSPAPAPESEEPKSPPEYIITKVCWHGVSIAEDCAMCDPANRMSTESLVQRPGKQYPITYGYTNCIMPEEPLEVDSPQNERIEQLSERIEKLESDLNQVRPALLSQISSLASMLDKAHLRANSIDSEFRAFIKHQDSVSTKLFAECAIFRAFMNHCEENGKKREERIKNLERISNTAEGFMLRLQERLEVLEAKCTRHLGVR